MPCLFLWRGISLLSEMRTLLFAFLLLYSCRDQEYLPPDPHDAWRIEGRWVALPPAHPIWHYDFDYPDMTQWIEDFGGIITTQRYIYAPDGDLVEIAGTGGGRTWKVEFFGDTVMQYSDVTHEGKWSPTIYLRRE